MKLNKKGFSMVEIIATVAILGILSVIGVISVNGIIERGKNNPCIRVAVAVELDSCDVTKSALDDEF